jgi:putative transposase
VLARKSIKQSYSPSENVLSLINVYRQITNEAIRIGLASDSSSLKKLSILSYKQLKRYNVPSCYKLCAISKAAGILSSRKKSIRRGYPTKDPYLKKPLLVSCYHFRVVNEKLQIPIGRRKFKSIPLNSHTMKILSDKTLQIRSFTITETSLPLCIAKEVQEMTDISGAVGIDRNLRNLTVGNLSKVTCYDMAKVVKIGETTKDIVSSFKRNDVRVRKEIASKYGRRKKNRPANLLNRTITHVVEYLKQNKQAIVWEDIKNIRKLYQRGNGKGKDYRRLMNNNWPFGEIKRQIEYKAAWTGVLVIRLMKGETRGTSLECFTCGERLQRPFKDHVQHKRQLWCKKCEKWFYRDYVAVMNISRMRWVRFAHSKGIGIEAMVQEPEKTTVILRVDPMKLGR